MSDVALDDAMQKQFKNVHHSIKSIFNILKEDRNAALPEVQDLIFIFRQKLIPAHEINRQNPIPRKKPFIVVEGLDGSGKTTITRIVAEKMSAAIMCTPPNSLRHLRETFDQFPPHLRRAFYALGNYAAALEVDDMCKDKPVVMDRFWHSTAAYGIAEELDGHNGMAGLPPFGNPLYNWPSELSKPDCVFLLTVSEETRNQRVGLRDIIVTEEEKKLSDNSSFRAILLEAYKRMNDPSLILIDANQEIDSVVGDVMKHLSKRSLLSAIAQISQGKF